MARIRTIKPEFATSSNLYHCEMELNKRCAGGAYMSLRTAYAMLFTAADREGRFVWDPDRLKLSCLPYDLVDFSLVLEALATWPDPFIQRYEVGGRVYGVILGFLKHQRPKFDEAKSEVPPPPAPAYGGEDQIQLLPDPSNLPPSDNRTPIVGQSYADRTPTVRQPSDSRTTIGVGREGKGTDNGSSSGARINNTGPSSKGNGTAPADFFCDWNDRGQGRCPRQRVKGSKFCPDHKVKAAEIAQNPRARPKGDPAGGERDPGWVEASKLAEQALTRIKPPGGPR